MAVKERGLVSRYWEAWEQQFTTLGFMRRLIGRTDNPYRKAMQTLWNVPDDIAETTLRSITSDLVLGDTFFWARPMLDVIQVAAAAIPNYTFDPTHLPAPHGWFWLEKPLPLTDVGQENIRHDPEPPSTPREWLFLRALSWGSYMSKPRENGRLEMRNALPGELPDHIGVAMWLRSPDSPYLIPTTHFFMERGVNLQPLIDRYKADRLESATYFPNEEVPWQEKVRYFACMLAFLDQRIFVTHHRESLPRHLRRRLEQEAEWQDLKHQRQDVRIVYLRRVEPATTDKEQEVVEWKCRWLVRGHWRQQPYRSEGVVRPKWIHPFVKGPAGKPLKAPEEDLFGVIR